MTRYLCWVAVLGVAALPDWATACRPRWRPVVYHRPACPVYAPPPVYVCPPVCHPAPGYVTPPPRIDPVPTAAPSPAPPPDAPARRPAPTRPPVVESVRPAGGGDILPSPMPPAPTAEPTPGPKFPAAGVTPKEPGAMPKLQVPGEPDFRPVPAPRGPAPERPSGGAPKLPPVPAPGGAAVPSPAPALPDPLIPPAGVLTVPDPKRSDAWPSLTLPPDSPVAPGKDTTSRSSPLTGGGGPRVSVFPAGGAGKTGPGYRTVGFYNPTAADLDLTIEGRAVRLPAKTYLYAQLGPAFTWAVGGRPAAREVVPDGAAGLDVVFRE